MNIYDKEIDSVIGGLVISGSVDYIYAIEKLVPLINKTEFQRKLQDEKFYEKLERDIEDGCVMPPITVAFVNTEIEKSKSLEDIKKYIEKSLKDSFVLDGIQRLNTLSRLTESTTLNKSKKLYVNFIFSDSVDKLLYRMITLNNGQRPMTPRHQVEVLLANVYNFEDFGIKIQSEKERSNKVDLKSFNKSDIIQAYLAFMANSPIVDNKKIIQEKMDNLLVNKIISQDPLASKASFNNVLSAISKFQVSQKVFKWLKVSNNLLGFSVGMKQQEKNILDFSIEEFENSIQVFEEAFSDFNPSKIKVGKLRRELSCDFIKNISKFKNYDSEELLEYFNDITAND